VDDNAPITQLISRAIKTHHPDYEIVEAHDGFRAGTILATLKPDVVLLDLRMPGMDGYEVCKLIKSQKSTQSAEVIAMTAYPSEENTQKILKVGARVCLAKPLDMDRLLDEIDASF
jgi:CheY-like chemotaxis protein